MSTPRSTPGIDATEILSQVEVPPDRALEILCRTELGLALWRAAVAEARSGVLAERIAQLQGQRSSPATTAN